MRSERMSERKKRIEREEVAAFGQGWGEFWIASERWRFFEKPPQLDDAVRFVRGAGSGAFKAGKHPQSVRRPFTEWRARLLQPPGAPDDVFLPGNPLVDVEGMCALCVWVRVCVWEREKVKATYFILTRDLSTIVYTMPAQFTGAS